MKKIVSIILFIAITGCTANAEKLPIDTTLKSFVVKQSAMIDDAVMNDHGVKTNDITEILKFVQYNDPRIKELNKTEKEMMDAFLTYSSACMNVSGAAKLDIVGCVKKKKELDNIVK
jgi:hypothetical protein